MNIFLDSGVVEDCHCGKNISARCMSEKLFDLEQKKLSSDFFSASTLIVNSSALWCRNLSLNIFLYRGVVEVCNCGTNVSARCTSEKL
jgi:hypothetical protein